MVTDSCKGSSAGYTSMKLSQIQGPGAMAEAIDAITQSVLERVIAECALTSHIIWAMSVTRELYLSACSRTSRASIGAQGLPKTGAESLQPNQA